MKYPTLENVLIFKSLLPREYILLQPNDLVVPTNKSLLQITPRLAVFEIVIVDKAPDVFVKRVMLDDVVVP